MPLRSVIGRKAAMVAWLFLISSASAGLLRAQTYFFDTYGLRQGLSEQKVYTLLQDSKDYLWLGTANGLSRFDGKDFKNFYTSDSLPVGGVKCILEDSLGYIWFGHLSGGGISRYDGKKFEKVVFDSITITGDVTGIAIVKGKLWFTSASDGAIQCDFPVSDIKHVKGRLYMGKEGLSDRVVGLTTNRDGSLICFAEDAGLKKYNIKEDKFGNYIVPQLTSYFSITSLLEDNSGNIWVGTYNGGLYRYIISESRMVFYDLIREGLKSNFVSCITEDSHGRIWAGTFGGGIAVFDGGKILKYDESNGLEAAKIYDIIEDREGNMLIADYDNGLTIYKGNILTVNDKSILPDSTVNAIYQDKSGTMWFGTKAGISRYSLWSDKKPVFYFEKGNSPFEDIRFFREDRGGNLWIGANKGGVVLYNSKTSGFEANKEINRELVKNSDGKVSAIEIDKQNRLWVGTDDGVIVGADNPMRYSLSESFPFTIGAVTSLYCDPSGNMWIGAEPGYKKPGLIKYDVLKNKFVPFYSLQGIIPRTMEMDSLGVMWIGTNDGVKAFKDDSIISTVKAENGLLSDLISLLKIGKDGSIYIGTNKGLNRYFPSTGRIFSYTQKNGFTGIEAKPNAVFESGSRELWFGTAYGAIRLSPEKISPVPPEPKIYISGMKVNLGDVYMRNDMKLKHNMNNLEFEFFSISFSNPDLIRYKIRLEGANEDWRQPLEQTRAIYSSLSPGKYTFMVKASDSQGVWSKEPTVFHFTIRPPYYLSWWFILAAGILILVVIIVYINIREKNLIREKMLLEQKVAERTAEVVQKSMIIEEKNRDITASIRYAERIQRAMLPPEETLPDGFVYYLPKDIVSGDFYWMYDNGDCCFIAAVDCTGHGVPGAFMSIIGHNSLNRVVRELGLIKPSEIMDRLNTEVVCTLLQRHEKSITDGMDMALISYNRKELTLEFAAAYNPLYIVRKGEVYVYKGDRFSIGISTFDKKEHFTNQVVEIRHGDMIYLCSDGYADQFGGPGSRKYKSGNVRKLLCEIYKQPLRKQKERLERELMEWKGDNEQVDDIMFIGIRVP
jgi:ligand-binding sensor domain-containing protein/serine phosphatase RsbU (regulator of sigma subunit)